MNNHRTVRNNSEERSITAEAWNHPQGEAERTVDLRETTREGSR